MESTTLLQRAIQCNNAGVCHLVEHRNVIVALRWFKKGIHCLEQLSGGERNSQSDCIVSARRLPGIEVRQREVHQADPAMSSCGKEEEDRPYVYNRPILLDDIIEMTNTTTSSSGESSPTFHSIVAAYHQACCIMLFNYALAHHRQCSNHPENKFHRHALRLYRMVEHLLESAPTTTTATITATATATGPLDRVPYAVLMVLVLNNCAEIHYYEECAYFHAERERERMTALMSGEHELFEACSLLSAEDLTGIISNAAMLTSPAGARAA